MPRRGQTPEGTPGQLIEVRSCKYDGRVQRLWEARIIEQAGTLLVLDAEFAEEIRHPLLGTILPGTLSTEYFWTDRWYSVFRFRQPSGELRNFYCNVNTPARLAGGVLSYVDLDIDVLVAPDLTYRVLDEDEFAAHAALYGYTEEVVGRALRARDEIVSLIEARQFPFVTETT